MAPLTLWLLVGAGVLFGALLGGVVALIALRRGQHDPDSVRALKGELADYRREVAEHYVETAKRVDALTHAYKAVYDHLEDGAYRLVGESELRQRLEDAGHAPVTLEGIGQRVLQTATDERRSGGDARTGPSAAASESARSEAASPGSSSSGAASEADADDEAEEAQRRA